MSEIDTTALADHLGRLLSQGLLNNGMPRKALLGDVAVQFGATPSRSAIKQALVIFNKRNGVQLTWEENRYNPTDPMLVSSVKVEPAPLAPVQLEEDEGDQEVLNYNELSELFMVNPALTLTQQALISTIFRWSCERPGYFFRAGELYRQAGLGYHKCASVWHLMIRDSLSGGQVVGKTRKSDGMETVGRSRAGGYTVLPTAFEDLLELGLLVPRGAYLHPKELSDWPTWLTRQEFLLLASIALRWRRGRLRLPMRKSFILGWPECSGVKAEVWEGLISKLRTRGCILRRGGAHLTVWVLKREQFNALLTEIGL